MGFTRAALSVCLKFSNRCFHREKPNARTAFFALKNRTGFVVHNPIVCSSGNECPGSEFDPQPLNDQLEGAKLSLRSMDAQGSLSAYSRVMSHSAFVNRGSRLPDSLIAHFT